jgi:hypothetical protein
MKCTNRMKGPDYNATFRILKIKCSAYVKLINLVPQNMYMWKFITGYLSG